MRRIIRTKYRLLRLLAKIFIILLLLPLIYNYIPVQKGKSTFYLSSSDTDSVIETLKKNGYSVYAIDKIILRYLKAPKVGWYTIKVLPKQRFQFFAQLYKKNVEIIQVKVYAGETKRELSKRLAKNLNLDSKKILLNYTTLSKYAEADILAGYYPIKKEAKEEEIITSLFHESNKRLQSFIATYYKNNHEVHELELKILLIIASIIQKETNDKEEMYLVSSVIQNRLNKGMRLQMDGTLNYGKHSHIPITPTRIREDKSYYNTYKHGGIPPAPLSSVSLDALKAALHPKKTDYLFFMLNKKGKHDFASTYKNHKENIKAFRKKASQKSDNNQTEKRANKG